MKVTWRELFGLSVALMLFGSGIWANLGSGSISQTQARGWRMPSNRPSAKYTRVSTSRTCCESSQPPHEPGLRAHGTL